MDLSGFREKVFKNLIIFFIKFFKLNKFEHRDLKSYLKTIFLIEKFFFKKSLPEKWNLMTEIKAFLCLSVLEDALLL